MHNKMAENIHKILTRYWGYASFRPLQEDIIKAVLEGRDTLALLPTGGGKSICFQVPALAMDGLCIVVTPLIALMKDQVANLQEKGIPAVAIYSGMTYTEIDIRLDNCAHGSVKFLYLSPERLQTELFQERLKRMKVCLLAIDESHCISQWGYDFRPPYLKIAEIRDYIPDTPVLALTATATPAVVKDIQEKLAFKFENVFQKSFERKNLTYAIKKDENKQQRLIDMLRKVKGCGIVYVRNRKKTREIAALLVKHNISADYYHAGLDQRIRDKKQDAWMKGHTRIIVSTNAFGMGIDKPNVRIVIHLDIPDCIEAYFQEAGRGGRDEKRAFAIILYNDADIMQLDTHFNYSYPELSEIKRVYNALGNYYQLPVGSGNNNSFDFLMTHFTEQYKMNPIIVFSAVKFLEKEGYLMLTESVYTPSKIYIPLTKEKLYKFQVANPYYDVFLKTLLRIYSGMFDEFIRIDEADIAHKLKLEKKEVVMLLEKLQKYNVIHYEPQKDKPQIIFTTERVDVKDLQISKENYSVRKKTASERLKAVKNYVESQNKCRSQILLAYFGETDSMRCGTCDVCKDRNKVEVNEMEFNNILQIVKPLLTAQKMTYNELFEAAAKHPRDKVANVLQWLIDKEKIHQVDDIYLLWTKKDA